VIAGYQKAWLRADVIAGFTAAAVVLPKAMAYATIAGLPVQVGLYTVLVPSVVYAALGTSRPLSVSTTTTLAILVGAELDVVAGHGTPALLGASATLALLVGAVLVAASLLRLGFVANFISEPVLTGFKAGIGLVIVLDQLPKLLGVHIEKGSFVHNVAATIAAVPDTSTMTFTIGALTILGLILLERFVPRAPAPLVAVACGIVAVRVFGLEDHGVAVVGEVPSGLPSFVAPNWSLVGSVWVGALGIALMSFTETVAAGRAFADPDEPPIDADRELLATGLANMGGALFGAMAAGGGTSQTAVNRRAGAQSQFAGVVTAVAAILIMLFFAGPMGRLPQATLAAIVIVYSVGLISAASFLQIRAVRRMEFYWALVAVAGVVLLGTLNGILTAILVSLVALAQQAAHPPVYVLGRKRGTNVFRPADPSHPDDETFPGLLLVRVEGRVFFANAARIGDRIRRLVAETGAATVGLDLSGVFDLEYSALKALVDAERRMRSNGVSIWLIGLTPPVLEMVRRSSLAETLGRERMFFNLEVAVRAYQERAAATQSPAAD
jgi:SulP family sulfate permease